MVRLFGYPIMFIGLAITFVATFLSSFFGAVVSLLTGAVLHGGNIDWVLQSGIDVGWVFAVVSTFLVTLATSISFLGAMGIGNEAYNASYREHGYYN